MFSLKGTWKTLLRPLSLMRFVTKEASWSENPLGTSNQHEAISEVEITYGSSLALTCDSRLSQFTNTMTIWGFSMTWP